MRRVNFHAIVESHPVLAIGAVLTSLLAIVSLMFADRQIVVNTSPSVPPGLYARSSAAPRVGLLIDFQVPAAAQPYIRMRSGNSGRDWYILKPIAAGPGDWIDTTGDWLEINGRRLASMPPVRDAYGHRLPVWRDARKLGPDEFFVFSDRIPNSFDSRCYGPITRIEIASVRRSLIKW